jgi:tRNA A37 threonylcarbamoyltransferase TsaD
VASSPLLVLVPEPLLCTDNAAMTAVCGCFRFQAGRTDGLALDVVPGLKLA